MTYDVLILGGGPAGLSAALALGRARKSVLLCDSGPRRNAAATHIQNFVTRDGTPPDDFRGVAREQLALYPTVEIRDVRIDAITGERGAFRASSGASTIEARRIVLATGTIDEMLPIDGFRELWGTSIFQCPYCHGWEVRDRRWAYLARAPEMVPFAIKLRGWTRDVVVLTGGDLQIDEPTRARLIASGVAIDERPIARLVHADDVLTAVAFTDGTTLPVDVLFAHPPQRHVDVVAALGLELDAHGSVQVDPMTRETSRPGIYAAGDVASRMQGAIFGAAAGTHAAAVINAELTEELAAKGELR